MLTKKESRTISSNTTGLTLILDASGSMDVRRSETIKEFNRYLDGLREDGREYKVTVVTFNDYTQTLIRNKPLDKVGDLERSEYACEGWTALLDAVGQTLNSIHEEDRNLVVVITDGEENRSRNYSSYDIRRLIDRKRDKDFQFVFLGSGPDSWSTGSKLGFNFSVSTDWNDARNSNNIYQSLIGATQSYSAGNDMKVSMFNTGSTTAQQTYAQNPTTIKIKP